MSIKKIEECFVLQRFFNEQVNPSWEKAGYPFHRAIWLEVAEAMGPTSWKWWKHQEHDPYQLLLEFVDIFHFAISGLMIRGGTPTDVLTAYSAATRTAKPTKDIDRLFEYAEKFVEELVLGQIRMKSYWELVIAFGFSIDDVLNTYIPKNTLNIFRQKNGYKDGSYVKEWDGIEDNKVLESIVGSLTDISYDTIYDQLTAKYPPNQATQSPETKVKKK